MALRGEFRGSSRKKSAASTALEHGSTTVIGAVQSGDIKSLRRLLRNKAGTEELNDRGETALMLAARLGDLEAIRLLIENGAALEAKGDLDTTALMIAAQKGDQEALRLLISKGADIDAARKKDGATVLMIATIWGHTGCVEDLIASGAYIFAVDIYGYTAQELALAVGDKKCDEILSAAEEAQLKEMRDGENIAEDTLSTAVRQPETLRQALAVVGEKNKNRRPLPGTPQERPPVVRKSKSKPPV